MELSKVSFLLVLVATLFFFNFLYWYQTNKQKQNTLSIKMMVLHQFYT